MLTQAGASALIQSYLSSRGVASEGLNASGLGGFDFGPLRIRFLYEDSSLLVLAPTYRFRKPPDANRLAGYKAEFGDALWFEEESQTLLFRTRVCTEDSAQLHDAIVEVATSADAFPNKAAQVQQ